MASTTPVAGDVNGQEYAVADAPVVHPNVNDAAEARGTTQQVSGTSAADVSPQLVALDGGGFVAVWQQGQVPAQVFARYYHDDGTPAGLAFAISPSGNPSETLPVATALPGGGFAVAWMDMNFSNFETGISARIYAAGSTTPMAITVGSTTVSTITVAATPNVAEVHPTITTIGSGFVVTWAIESAGTATILAQKFTAAGLADGGRVTITTAAAHGSETGATFNPPPQVATALADGSYVVSWPQDDGTHARIVHADGSTSADITLAGGAKAIAPYGAGFIVTWLDTGTDNELHARIYGVDGQPIGADLTLTDDLTRGETSPVVATLPDGRFVVAWFGDGNQSKDIFARVYLADGTPSGEEAVHITNTGTVASGPSAGTPISETQPTITVLDDGSFVVGWLQPFATGGQNPDVFLHVYNPGIGTVAGPANHPLDLPTTFALTDRDGSEILQQVRIEGLPAGFTVSDGTHVFGAREGGDPDGAWVIDAADGASFLAGLAAGSAHLVLIPAHNFVGDLRLVVTATSRETEEPVLDGREQATSAAVVVPVTFLTVVENAAPVATAPSTHYGAVEQIGLDLKNTGLSVSDADASGSETITLSVQFGKLNASAGDSGVTIDGGNGTASLVVSGTIAALNAFLGAGGTSTLTYIADSDMPPAGTTLTLTINDNDSDAKTGSASAPIDIAAVDDPASVQDDHVDTAEDTAITFDVRTNDTDPDSAISVTAINGTQIGGGSIPVSNGIVTLNADGTLTFTPAADFNGETSFTYRTGGLHFQLFDGQFSTVAAIPTDGGIQGYIADFDVGSLSDELTGSIHDFGLRYTGTIRIVAVGTYTFFTTSDDGSALYVDGIQVVNNDFSQGATERSGAVLLSPGQHAIEIRYFQGGGPEGLKVDVSGPDTANTKTALLDSSMIVSTTATVDVTVSAVNDAPVFAGLDATVSATEQVPLPIDSSVTVSDAELDALNGGLGNYTGASLTLARQGGGTPEDIFGFAASTSFTVEGAALKSGGAVFATFDVTGGTLTITFTSAATAATSALVNDLLGHITYANASDAPPASVALAYTFDDGTGATGTAVTTVTIGAIDDSPTLTDDDVSTSENVAVKIDVLANDSDPDSALAVSAINGAQLAAGATVAVANGSVTLNADGTLTFTPAANFHGDTSFTYQAGSGLHYQFFDRTFDQGFGTVANIPVAGGAEGFASDFDVTALAQSLTGGTDYFGIRYTGTITIVTGGTYTFFTTSDDGSALYIDGVTVVNNDFSQGATERSGSTTLAAGRHAIEIRYFEGGGGQELNVNVSGPDTSSIKTALFDSALLAPASATVDVSVAPANTSPHLLNLNDSAHTIEQTPMRLDDNAFVVDADLDPLNGGQGLYTGASLTLLRRGGADAEDTYAFDTAGALFTVSGNALQSGGATFATFVNTGGTLTVTFTSSETAATTALVSDVLHHIVYTNTSDDPSAQIVLAYTFDDGSPGNGQGVGGQATVTEFTAVGISPANDAPALTVAGTAAYTEGDAFVTLDPTLAIADTDGGLGYSATVKIVSGYLAGDTLTGGGHFDAATQTFTTSGFLAPNATRAMLQVVLQGLRFSTTSDNPGDQRKLEWTISDGSTENATFVVTTILNVTSVDDAPIVPGPVTLAAMAEDGARLITQADLLVGVTDPDGPVSAVGLAIAAGGGVLIDNHDGTWTYLPTTNDDTSVSFAFALDDGIAAPVPNTATLDITPVNDAPVNVLPAPLDIDANTSTAIGSLSIVDPDAASGSLTTTLSVAHGTLTVAAAGGAVVTGSGTGTVTLNGTLAQINATLGAVNNVVYLGAHDDFGNDTLTMVTNDNGNTGSGGPLVDTDQATIHLNTHLVGTPGPDSFAALTGNERIDALTGIDTITFGFRLVDAIVTYVGNEVIIDGPSSHTVLTGFETYVFTDGTVNNKDADPLVDDLFYYSQYHDVWNAHVDADQHYHQYGWHEGRDPDAFFSTVVYLSANPDVKASGADPLVQFDQTGWKAGHNPLGFDVNAYLAANPDVRAAHADPLEHFLSHGAQEGRQPIAPTELLAANGFDYVYYLQHNPDVAAAHVDPLWHFETIGWKEGRNPNALFDTNGYLATYADVKAANINPLDHYNEFGWHEGRDPSVAFDTTDYLSHYPDVANAHINPLNHFLASGIHEGRSPFADGMWG